MATGPFMSDPGVLAAIRPVPSSNSDEEVQQSRPARQSRGSHPARANTSRRVTRPASVHESDNDDSEDSLVAGQKEPKKRKRKTKAQIEAEKYASLIRDITDEPPKNGLNPRQLRELGAAGVGYLEQDQSLFKARTHNLPEDISQGRGSLTFDDIDLTTERFKRRINKTDSSIYKKQKTNIGLNDIDDSDEYDEDPVMWAGRDKALKTAINYQGSQFRAAASTLGHATPMNFEPDGSIALLSPILGDDAETMNMRRAARVQPMGLNTRIGGDDDEIDTLFDDAPFADIEDVENAIAPSDVIQLDKNSSQAPALSQVPIPRTSKPLDWDHADGWAKTLREKHGFDFTRDGGRLDLKKILGTHKLPQPQELERLNHMDVDIKIEDDDDELFVALRDDYEQKEREKERRRGERAAIMKRHEIASKLFRDLRACVMTLMGNQVRRRDEQEQARSEQMRIPDLGRVREAPALSFGERQTRALGMPVIIDRSEPQQTRVPTGPRNGRNQDYRRDDYPAPRQETQHNRRDREYDPRGQSQRGAYARNDRDERYSRNEDTRSTSRAYRSDDRYSRPRDEYRRSDDNYQRDCDPRHRGERNLYRTHHRDRSKSPRSRYNDANYQPGQDRFSSRPPMSRGGCGSAYGGSQRGQSDRGGGLRTRGGFEWRSGANDRNAREAPADFKPWNPDADELDPIKRQFGGR